MRARSILSVALACWLIIGGCQANAQHSARKQETLNATADSTVATRFVPPQGSQRIAGADGSFAYFLQNLPLEPPGSPVHLYNGEPKNRQDVQAAVIDISIGPKDLQQCADAVMRLRAEYLFANGKQDAITFNFTSGFKAEWERWRKGERIKVEGNTCSWVPGSKADASHAQLLRYLDMVFTYAGTLSLQRELSPAGDHAVQGGDIFIQGGSPGHAVIVVDVARFADGRTAFLLAQSYMPAQDIHLLKNLRHPEHGAWFMLEEDDRLYTPEWTFTWNDRRRWP